MERKFLRVFNSSRIPLVLGIMFLLLSSVFWINQSLEKRNDLIESVSNEVDQVSHDLEEEILSKVVVFDDIFIASWLDVSNFSSLLDGERFTQMVKPYFEFFPGYLAVNLVDADGIVRYVYPTDPNSILLNKSILYNVDGQPNLTIREANRTRDTAMSTFVTFFQGGSGLTAYLPVIYNGDIVAYFNVVFRTDQIFEEYISNHQSLQHFSFVIRENETTVFQYNGKIDLTNDFTRSSKINYFSKSWDLFMVPIAQDIRNSSPFSNIYILLTGVVAAALAVVLSKYLLEINERQKEKYLQKEKYDRLMSQLNKINALGTMAGGMAHDFNNMLMIIQGNISLLSQNKDDFTDQQQQFLDNISTTLKEASNLTRQILSFSRYQIIENDRTDIVEAVSIAIENYSPTTYGDVEIETSFPSGPVYVYANRSRLTQIIINLMKNAEQAINALNGKILITIEVKDSIKRTSGKVVEVSVVDNGEGISDAIIDNIFDPFFTTKQIGKGTGLGLSIAYQYITSIDGHLRAESKVGTGTSMTITLPVITDNHYQITSPLVDTNLIAKCKSSLTDAFGDSISALVIEDENYIARVIEHMLGNVDADVVHFSNGQQGLSQYERHPNFDLVILDINLPGLNGVDIFRRIQELNPMQYIIFVTGFAEEINSIRLEDYPRVSLLQKPFSQDEFYIEILKLVAGEPKSE